MTRVLLVDDDRSQAEEFAILLRDSDCEVTVASDGAEAIQILARALPDIVLTDLDMPVIDGLELVQAIRRDYPGLPVILMTAMGTESTAAKALRHGAASYVRKRSLAREIVQTVGSVLAVVRALPTPERVLDSVTDGELSFVLSNDPAQVPPVLGYLEQLASLLHPRDKTERIRVGIALNEALCNAIQHGNLELDSELRQEGDQPFRELGEQRRTLVPYRERRVRLRATLSRSHATYVVEDEGHGFDPSTVPDPTEPANLERIGGRGLMLIRTFMDEVEHNEKGNRITMRKRYSTPQASPPVAATNASAGEDTLVPTGARIES
jgi:CheY-like chemotaxis protein/anti-sigma regulatory factor (Ser/Thr protein kinase)